jgi:hypothetical protein
MRFWQLIHKAKEFWGWYSFIVGVITLLVAGVGVAVGGAVWLVRSGIPLPLAGMVAYCTIVAAIWSALAPFVFRAFVQKNSIALTNDPTPNYALWRNRQSIYLGEAACLFADLIPSAQNKTRANVREYLGSLVDAARSGEMKFIFLDPDSARSNTKADYERQIADDNTRVTLDALRGFARKRLYTPKFLRDD